MLLSCSKPTCYLEFYFSIFCKSRLALTMSNCLQRSPAGYQPPDVAVGTPAVPVDGKPDPQQYYDGRSLRFGSAGVRSAPCQPRTRLAAQHGSKHDSMTEIRAYLEQRQRYEHT